MSNFHLRECIEKTASNSLNIADKPSDNNYEQPNAIR
jgi:hypothetical protein